MSRGTVELVDRDREVRLHLQRGLGRMTPAARIAFVNRMCRLTNSHGLETKVTDHSGTTAEAFWDVCLLAVNHGLDLNVACSELERVLRCR